MLKYSNVKMTRKGYALIELLVAATIFAIIIVAISSLFISGIRTQGRVLATQEVLDQASYVMEYVSRALRMAKKDESGTCISTVGNNYELTTNGIQFIDKDDVCTEFFLDSIDKQLKKRIGGTTSDLTSSNLQVNAFRISLSGEAPADGLQPKVTISLEMLGRKIIGMAKPKIQIQTSVSQRNLDMSP